MYVTSHNLTFFADNNSPAIAQMDGKQPPESDYYAVQGHSRSPILVPIESSGDFLLVIIKTLTYLLFCPVSKLWLIIGQIFASGRRVPHFNALRGGDALRISL